MAADPRAFLRAAKTGDLPTVEQLLREGEGLLAYTGAGTPDGILGNTALHWAAANGHVAVLEALLAAGADVHARNNGDSTPLHSASTNNRVACARALVAARADPLVADEYGDSPLKLAERAERTDMVAVLKRAPDGDAPARSAEEHKEAGNAHFKRGEYSLAITAYTDALAAEPGHAAALSNRSGAYAALGRWALAERDARAAVERRPDWPKAHARLAAALEGGGDLPGAIAAYQSAVDADVASGTSAGGGDEPSKRAVYADSLARVRTAWRARKLEALFERGAFDGPGAPAAAAAAPPPKPPKSREEQAYAERVRAWHAAAKGGNVSALQSALRSHADLLHNRSENTAERLLGNSALHWAAAYGHVDAARWLLGAGADVLGRNLGGSTPLHSAAAHARADVCQLLLDSGASVDAQDENGDTARDAAERRGYHGVTGLLDRGPLERAVRFARRPVPQSAAAAREEGNACFARGGGALRVAIRHYTDALLLLGPGPEGGADAPRGSTDDGADESLRAPLLSNRSAAHASLGQHRLALEDAEAVTRLRPDWAKGWGRVGAAHHLGRDWQRAVRAYERGLELDPSSAALVKGLHDAREAAAADAAAAGASGP